jgi:hypothetical protein
MAESLLIATKFYQRIALHAATPDKNAGNQ